MKRLQSALLVLFLVLSGSSIAAGQDCTAAGTWTFNVPALGSSTWSVDASGATSETGMGASTGTTVVSGRTLTYTWTTRFGYDGRAVINLNDACNSGTGTVTWTKFPATETRGPSFEATLTRLTWGAGGEPAAIRAELRNAPTEVWVGWGRPSMAAGIFITGFRRNTADPVVIECLAATNSSGDHTVAGDPLKTVRISPCGANQQTYDWPAEGYNWGIMISAPARDIENDQQPGRRRDVCIGTNPVRVRISQKGAGEAFVTISPQLLLKAGQVGGGGTYSSTSCTEDTRGRGGDDEGSIRAELRNAPTEVWVGWGRPSMAAGIFITGFRRNTADPVMLDCLDATNASGDHSFAGDQLKTVRISPCGASQQTYDWPAEGYNWGIMISAPARDLENDRQPGRRRDVCIGTNPVRVRISQQGAGQAFVTISPQLLLQAGLVGGGGTYAPSRCRGDERAGGGALNGQFAIQTARGNFLTAVRGGGVGGPDAIHSDATRASGWETFTVVAQSDGKYAIRTTNGNFLTAIGGGGRTGLDVIHTNATTIDAWEKFTLEQLDDGYYAIRTANGNYLTAVNGGGAGTGKPSIHSNAKSISGWEKFRFVKIP